VTDDDRDSVDLLVQKLRWLRLPAMAKLLPSLIDLAAKDNLSTLDVVHRLCDEEKQSRLRSAVEKRIRDARFPEVNTVDAFDFDFDPARKKLRARYLALHDLAFLDKGVNPLFIGHPGTGKTFLARALAYKACTAARRVVFISAPRMLNDHRQQAARTSWRTRPGGAPTSCACSASRRRAEPSSSRAITSHASMRLSACTKRAEGQCARRRRRPRRSAR
jgi:DNA replication protein DnaC